MFTGIIEELGTVVSLDGPRLRISADEVLDDITMGASTAVNGVCLTVVAWGEGWWEADVSDETFARTSLGSLRPGDPVNLERPVRLQDRLGGHLVQGHVDGTGRLERAIDPVAGGDLWASVPQDLQRYCVVKGSITLDGVSLTIAGMRDGQVRIAVIPHTAQQTTLGSKVVGDPLHVEVDVLAKYVERLLAPRLPSTEP